MIGRKEKLNQTSFAHTAPVLQTGLSATPSPADLIRVEAQRKAKLRFSVLMGGVVLIFLAVFIMLWVIDRQTKELLEPEIPPIVTEDIVTTELTLKEKILQLSQEVKQADPSKTDQRFPQVDDQIRLDPKPRN